MVMSKQSAQEETGLMARSEFSSELAPTSAQAEKQFEIQSAIIIANKFPRNEMAAFEQLTKACKRLSFAEQASYAFPRGGQTISGPSVHLARGAARVWKNLQYGVRITRDDDDSRQLQAFAWDLETNVKVTAEDDFKKLVYRKKDGWVKPDERDLRELTNRRGAILARNCILQILPKDLIEDAREECAKTIRKGVVDDPESARKRLVMAFSDLNVTPVMLEELVGHSLAQCSPAEIQKLREVYQSIKDGNSTWKEYVTPAVDREVEKGTLNINDLKPGGENRGHGNENLAPEKPEPLPENTQLFDTGPSADRSMLIDCVQGALDAGLTADEIKKALKPFGESAETIPDDKCKAASSAIRSKVAAKNKS